MVPIKQTLMIERAIEQKSTAREKRFHIGASVIGNPCMRAIWYDFRWTTEEFITARLQRLFNRGHMEEIVVIEDLINAGCKVRGVNIDESIENRFKTVFNHTLPKHKQINKNFAFGYGGGSCDCIIENLPDAPKKPHLLEVKTSNTKNFMAMKRNGVEKTQNTHFVQMQIYMKLFGLKRFLYIMVCKETDERHYERGNYNKEIADSGIEKAEQIILSQIPPSRLSTDKDYYLCKWCKHRELCHDYLYAPEKSCRSCESIIFLSQNNNTRAIVRCKRNSKKLSFKKQKKGCKKYSVDPVFLT